MLNKILIFLIIFCVPTVGHAQYAQFVNGYCRSDGTCVQGYSRTSPDSTVQDNYSYYGSSPSNLSNIWQSNINAMQNRYNAPAIAINSMASYYAQQEQRQYLEQISYNNCVNYLITHDIELYDARLVCYQEGQKYFSIH